LLKGRDIWILSTGIGRENAVDAVSHAIQLYQPDYIVNAGMAGALDPRLKSGEALRIEKIISAELSKPAILLNHDQGNSLRKATLVSVEKPLMNAGQKKILRNSVMASCVDMEAYETAEICFQKRIPFVCVKVISDQADENTKSEFKANIHPCSNILAESVLKFIRSKKF
jgi:adenosylhomocysteine nucleosidase